MSEAMYCGYDDLLAQVNEDDLLQQADMSAPPPLYHEPEESDDADDPRVEERDNITPAIVNASAEIAGYLARRYVLPESPAESPAMLRKLCSDIAIYNVYSRKGFQFGSDKEDMIVYQRYKNAIEYLKAVADEKLDIEGLDDGSGADDEEDDDDGVNYGRAHIRLYRS